MPQEEDIVNCSKETLTSILYCGSVYTIYMYSVHYHLTVVMYILYTCTLPPQYYTVVVYILYTCTVYITTSLW